MLNLLCFLTVICLTSRAKLLVPSARLQKSRGGALISRLSLASARERAGLAANGEIIDITKDIRYRSERIQSASQQNILYFEAAFCGQNTSLAQLVVNVPDDVKYENDFVLVEVSTTTDFAVVVQSNYVVSPDGIVSPLANNPAVIFSWPFNPSDYTDGKIYIRAKSLFFLTRFSLQLSFTDDATYYDSQFSTNGDFPTPSNPVFEHMPQYLQPAELAKEVKNDETNHYRLVFCEDNFKDISPTSKFRVSVTIIARAGAPYSGFGLILCPGDWSTTRCSNKNIKIPRSQTDDSGVAFTHAEIINNDISYNLQTNGVIIGVTGQGGDPDENNLFDLQAVILPPTGP